MAKLAERGVLRVGTPKSKEDVISPQEFEDLRIWIATGKDPREKEE